MFSGHLPGMRGTTYGVFWRTDYYFQRVKAMRNRKVQRLLRKNIEEKISCRNEAGKSDSIPYEAVAQIRKLQVEQAEKTAAEGK